MGIPSLAPPNVFDCFVVALIVASMITAFRRGLVRSVLSLSGLIAGVLLATCFQLQVIERMQSYLAVGILTQLLLFAAILVAVYAVFHAVGAFTKESTLGAGMGLGDRLLAVCCGGLRGAMMGAILLAAISVTAPRSPAIDGSALAPYVLAGTHAVSFIVPQTFRDQTGPQTDQKNPAPAHPLEARILNQQ